MKELVVLGSGGNAEDLFDVVDAINDQEPAWTLAGVLDDSRSVGSDFQGVPVLGGLGDASSLPREYMFVSTIWNTQTFRRLDEILGRTGLPVDRFTSLVHPGAGVSKRATLGRGVVVNFGASIAGRVSIADFVSVGPRCVIGHNTTIGSFTTVAPGAVVGGGVTIASNCYIGSGSLVRQLQTIARGTLIGMGAVVVDDTDIDSVTYGNPARAKSLGETDTKRRTR